MDSTLGTRSNNEQETSKSLMANLSPKAKFGIKLTLRWWDFLSDCLLFADIMSTFPELTPDCMEEEYAYGCTAPWIVFFSFLFTITMEFFKSLPALYSLCDNDADFLLGEHSPLPSGVDSPLVIFTILMKPNVMEDLFARYDDIVEKDYKAMVAVLLVEDVPSIVATLLILRHSGGNFFALFSLAGSIVASIQAMSQIRKMNK